MKTTRLAVISLAAFAFMAACRAAPNVTIVPVAGPISMVSGPGGNVAVIADPKGAVLIDAKDRQAAQALKSAITAIPGGNHVRLVINTHWHGDHTGGNVVFAPPASVVAHENVVPLVSRDNFIAGGRTVALPPDARPSITYTDRKDLPAGAMTLRLVHYAHAHTDGDTVVYIEPQNVVHMGDMFFNGMFPFLDVDNGGDIVNWVRQLDVILNDLPGDVKIIPGHGPLAGKKDLMAFRDMLADSAAFAQKLVEAGKTLEQAKATPLPARFDAWSRVYLRDAEWVELVYRSVEKNKPVK